MSAGLWTSIRLVDDSPRSGCLPYCPLWLRKGLWGCRAGVAHCSHSLANPLLWIYTSPVHANNKIHTHTHSMPLIRNCANTIYHLCPQSDSNYQPYINNSFFLETFCFKKHFLNYQGMSIETVSLMAQIQSCTLKTEFQLLLHQPVWDK